jgi:hypothetical protein
MIRSLAALIIVFLCNFSADAGGIIFAVAETDTPVLNTPDFKSVFGGKDGKTLGKDRCGQLRSLEFVAMPGTVFKLEEELQAGGRKLYRVTTPDYPYPSKSGYFIDSRFVRIQSGKPAERKAILPSREAIIAALKKMNGSRYVWGGNNSHGIPEMLQQYAPNGTSNLNPSEIELWTLKGVDCSGLLYEATRGYTPRNTSALANYGKSVKIAGKSLKSIAEALEPLDLIVWPGHVLIVIDSGNLIESRLVCKEPEKGVRIRPTAEALTDIMKRRAPADNVGNSGKEFVVRRWYGVQ